MKEKKEKRTNKKELANNRFKYNHVNKHSICKSPKHPIVRQRCNIKTVNSRLHAA